METSNNATNTTTFKLISDNEKKQKVLVTWLSEFKRTLPRFY